MLTEFLTWWRDQLLALVRLPPAPGGVPDGNAIVVALIDLPQDGPARMELLTRRRGRECAVGRFDLGTGSGDVGGAALRTAGTGLRGPVLLRLFPGLLLEQSVTLPLAAEREPERVLAYEMDRLTPFNTAELFWTWALEWRDRAANQVRFRLSLVPNARLLPVLDALAAAGLRPVALDAVAADGTLRRLALAQVRAGWWRRHGMPLAACACAVLAAAAAALPFVTQGQAAQRVEDRIAALRPRVDQAEALRRAALGQAASTDVVQAGRAQVGDALHVLATLTSVLPDDTSLTELTLRSRVLAMTGESAGAARLIATLDAEPGFRNPAFSAPVTRNASGRMERFSIRAEVAP